MALPTNGKLLQFKQGTLSEYNGAVKDDATFYLVQDTSNNNYYIYIGDNPISANIAADNEVNETSANAVSGQAVSNYVKGQIGAAIEVDYAEDGISSSNNPSDDSAAIIGHFRYYDDNTLKFKYKDGSIVKLQHAFEVGDKLSFIADRDGVYTLNLADEFISTDSDIAQAINSALQINGNLSVGTGNALLVDTIDVLNADKDTNAVLVLNHNTQVAGALEIQGNTTISNNGSLKVEGNTELAKLTATESTFTNATINGPLINTGVFTTNQATENNANKAQIVLDGEAQLKFGLSGAYYLTSNEVKLPEITSESINATGAIHATGTISTDKDISADTTITAGNNLLVGSSSGGHLTIAANEIIAYGDVKTYGELKLNSAGGAVSIGNGGLTVGGALRANDSFTVASTLTAESGVIMNSTLSVASTLTLNNVGLSTVAEGTEDGKSGVEVTNVNNRLKIADDIVLTKKDIDESNGLIKTQLTSLQGNIDTLQQNLEQADVNLGSAISGEAARASAAEQANTAAIEAEVTRAQAAEEAEAKRAKAAEEANTALINGFLFIGPSLPNDISAIKLWIDTSVATNGVIKYYNEASENWIAVNAVWG